MAKITSFEILDKQIGMRDGQPLVLEALWDGDTSGWFLVINLYVLIQKPVIKEKIEHLGIVSFGGDIRLFSGEVPAWPEAELAKEWGQKAAEKYGLVFYFPSEKEPDDDCPSWTERHKAIKCADCGKLIIPTTSSHLPKDICYNCHLTRERNKKIIQEVPCDTGVNMFISKGEEFKNIGYCTQFDMFAIAPFINDVVQARLTEKAINIITLDNEDIVRLKVKLENALDEKLATYKKPVIEEEMKNFVRLQTIQYKGRAYDLLDRRNREHEEIARLFSSLKTAEEALLGQYNYRIFFKKGLTNRDDTVLRFVNYVCKGTTNIAAIIKRYSGIITEKEVLNTLKKLAQIDCLQIEGTEISITRVGKCIL